jgi:hypothetical protein
MGTERAQPDLSVALSAESFAPRLARHAVGSLDRPSPDLRDAVMLLTSNLVARACRRARDPSQMIELRAWMPRTVVRVEMNTLDDLALAAGDLALTERAGADAEPSGQAAPDGYDRELLDGLADRWGIERDGERTWIWFEIDRIQRA